MRGLVVETARKLVRLAHGIPVLGRVLDAFSKEREHAIVLGLEDRLRDRGYHKLKYGPFKGMTYPDLQHFGYTSLPMKFLGTYERHLNDVIEKSLGRGYALVLNVGAADGYYACGYAYRLPKAKVIAWEMIPFVAELVTKLARANNVTDRVEVRGLCTSEELRAVVTDQHAFILSDCEGAEVDLMTHENLAHLKSYDFIIECHDHFSPDATKIIYDRFSRSHDLQVLESLPIVLNDIPAEAIADAGGASLDLFRSLEENRLYSMRWIFGLDKRSS